MPFKEDLLAFLRDAENVLFIGIGNVLRRDDAAGIKVVKILKKKGMENVLNCESSPENYTGIIKKLHPSHIIFFDAVEMGREPGHYEIIEENALCEYIQSTHKISLRLLFQILRMDLPNVKILFVGIQPKNIDFGRYISRPVRRGINSLVNEIIEVMKK
ncbi:MAG: hydrogenase maturation protease [Candidatus Methanomethyliaceae archaeon]|nr:hydrogenase maturation protease [Candidatus Methanomethyliaceae archaeon]MDW7971154.1 hydrogenase maturation protease [Nitrososphaerota archaeon]